MLELHEAAHVKTEEAPEATDQLKAIDVQRFVMNEWSWMDDWLVSNAGYSAKSRVLAAGKGLV